MIFGTFMLYLYALANLGPSVGSSGSVNSAGQGQTVTQDCDGHRQPDGGSPPKMTSVVWGT